MLDASRQTALLCAEAVGHQFQPTWWCLKDISLQFHPGELIAVSGPNGAGKTTLMQALTGQLRPAEGQVTLDGHSLHTFRSIELARHIGYMPQNIQTSFSYTCVEVVAQGRYPHLGVLGIPSKHDLEIIMQAMEWTHTNAFANRPIQSLSGGERQRVMLASVLAQGTDFLLLDEPTAALDIHHEIEVFERIQALARSGLGIIVITHDLNIAALYCDKIALLHEGRLAAYGTPAQVLTESILGHVYQASLIVQSHPQTGTPLVIPAGRNFIQPPLKESIS